MSTMMKAFYVKGEDAGLRSIPVPVPGRNEVLIKVLRAGICNTDIKILKGYMGFEGVVGHEFVGIVKEIGKDTENFESTSKKLLNKRVCGDINCACFNLEDCATCTLGGDLGRNHCPTRTVLGILGKTERIAST